MVSKSGFLAIAWVLLSLPPAAMAQDHQPPFVESIGQGTVYGVPTEVSFILTLKNEGETLEASLEAAERFESAAKVALAAHPVQPLSMAFPGPTVESPETNEVRSTVVLRFGLSTLGGTSALADFGRLCDGIGTLAESLGATLAPPALGVAQEAEDAMIREAVQLATENAYTGADSAASALGTTILTINLVQVLETSWNDPGAAAGPLPNLRQYACTARVRVLYELNG